MTNLIFPGFSSNNRSWAESVKSNLTAETLIIDWPHWKTGKVEENWKEKIIEGILKDFKGKKPNIIAKSVGTIVLMMLLRKDYRFANKIILCGIPVSVFKKNDDNLFYQLKLFPQNNLLVIQNENDPFASYKSIKEMFDGIDKNITVVLKPANTHDYPYFKEFNSFLV